MIVLGIESTCDETAASLVEDGRHLLSNVISTSVKEQDVYKRQEYGFEYTVEYVQ